MNYFVSLWARYKQLSRAWRYSIALGVVVLGIMGIRMVSGGSSPAALETVRKGSISQTVSVTGRLKPAQEVQLAFQSSGRVGSVPVAVGARVQKGQLLASLDLGELSAQLREATAGVQSQTARLDELQQGTRPEDLAITQASLNSAEQALADAYADVYNVLLDSFTKTDNAVRLQLINLFDSEGTAQLPQYTLSFSCPCDAVVSEATALRASSEVALNRWAQELDAVSLNATNASLIVALHNAHEYVQSAKAMLSRTNDVLAYPNPALSTATLTAYRTSVSAASANATAALAAVSTQEQLITTQQLAVQRIRSELALKQAGSSAQAIAAQQAAVQSAQAGVERVQALIAKGVIRSPIAGVVTMQDAKVGQTATAGVSLVGVMSDQQLEIEANVPEVDIGKVSVGDEVMLTVDALPGEALRARVTFIDPAETVIDGVVNFRILAQLEQSDERLKSGLTVNMDIVSDRHDDVLLLPQFAVIEKNEGTFVRRPDGTETAVGTGIRSQDGMVEITSGLAEGDSVMNIGLKSAQ